MLFFILIELIVFPRGIHVNVPYNGIICKKDCTRESKKLITERVDMQWGETAAADPVKRVQLGGNATDPVKRIQLGGSNV